MKHLTPFHGGSKTPWSPAAETLWLRPDLREQVGSAARLIEKGVVCWRCLPRRTHPPYGPTRHRGFGIVTHRIIDPMLE